MAVPLDNSPGATVIASALVGFEFGKFSSGQPRIGEELVWCLSLHMVTRIEFTHSAAIALFPTGRNRPEGLHSQKLSLFRLRSSGRARFTELVKIR